MAHALSKVLQCPIIGEWLLTLGYFFAPNVSQLDSLQDDIALFQSTYVIDTTPIQHEDNKEVRNLHMECIVSTWTFWKGTQTIKLAATRGPPIEGIFSYHLS